MYEVMIAVLLSIVFGFFSINFFPTIHTLINSVDVSSTIPLVQFIVRLSPYFIIFIVIYTCIMMVKKRVNK
jgi:hypothetical protein